MQSCSGIAALPSLGVVLVADYDARQLLAHRLSDGFRVASLQMVVRAEFLAADDASGALFGSVAQESGREAVHRWQCANVGAGIVISSGVPVAAAGTNAGLRMLAVMPPAPGKRAAHLVVGTCESSELLVLSLPGLALVHTHNLEGMKVDGLAADPWGGAIAVCDAVSDAIHVLAWPLPGMPLLD